MVDTPVEQLIVEWAYNEFYRYKGKIPDANSKNIVSKALLEVAGADGSLTEAERRWIMGLAAVHGAKKEQLDVIKAYKRGSEDATAHFNTANGQPLAEQLQALLIFNGFRAAAADGPLKQKKTEAIIALAKKLDMNDDRIQELHELYEDVEKQRQKRIAFLFPQGYDHAVNAIDKHYGR